MNTCSELIFRGLPICTKGHRHLVAIKEDSLTLTLVTTRGGQNVTGKYFISLPENDPVFNFVVDGCPFSIKKVTLLRGYGISFLDFKTISE